MKKTHSRLTSLDGIRGLAMILVFLNHVDPTYIVKLLPSWLAILSPTFFASGVLGVSFLFVLTGFLMAYIYPHPSQRINFVQKRYTRIFPLFLTMCTAMLVLRNIPSYSYLATIPVLIVIAIFTHTVWVHVIKKINNKLFSKTLFFLFIIFQILIGFLYTFVIIKFPPIVFNQQIPAIIRESMVGFVNASLTLPLGNYIPMLDGVYWSLTSEILFYILYPVICVPFIIYLASRGRFTKILFLITLIPLFAGADLLSHKILVISMLQISLFSYFVAGMVLGYLYKNKPHIFENLSKPLPGPLKYWSILAFVLALITPHYINQYIPAYLYPWLNLIWALPFGIIIAIAINEKTYLAKILSSKILVFIGLISYSIYLSHASVLHMVETIFHPTGIFTNFILILGTFIITVLVSYILYNLLEKPYFIKSKETDKTINSPMLISGRRISLLIIAICVLYVSATFYAFQSDFNFFSEQFGQSRSVITSPNLYGDAKTISLQNNQKILMAIKAEENNLGVITMNISHEKQTKTPSDTTSQLMFRIKEQGSSSWYSTTGYDLFRIKDGTHYPFGFPSISNSKDKTYIVELYLSNPKTPDNIILNAADGSVRTVYPVSKTELIKNPVKFASFIKNRIVNVSNSQEARYSLLFFTPFLFISLYLFFSINKRNYLSKS